MKNSDLDQVNTLDKHEKRFKNIDELTNWIESSPVEQVTNFLSSHGIEFDENTSDKTFKK